MRIISMRKGASGYGFTISGEKPCIVNSVAVGSSAEQTGLKCGDRLLSVDSINVQNASHDDIVELISSHASSVCLGVEHAPYNVPDYASSEEGNLSSASWTNVKNPNMRISQCNASKRMLEDPHKQALIDLLFHRKINSAPEKSSDDTIGRFVVKYLGSRITSETAVLANGDKVSSQSVSIIHKQLMEQHARDPKLRYEVLTVLSVLKDAVVLTSQRGCNVASWSADRILYCSVLHGKYFTFIVRQGNNGLCPQAMAVQQEASSSRGGGGGAACCCHVFMTESALTSHPAHARYARSFRLSCTRDRRTNTCAEFPPDAAVVVMAISHVIVASRHHLRTLFGGSATGGSHHYHHSHHHHTSSAYQSRDGHFPSHRTSSADNTATTTTATSSSSLSLSDNNNKGGGSFFGDGSDSCCCSSSGRCCPSCCSGASNNTWLNDESSGSVTSSHSASYISLSSLDLGRRLSCRSHNSYGSVIDQSALRRQQSAETLLTDAERNHGGSLERMFPTLCDDESISGGRTNGSQTLSSNNPDWVTSLDKCLIHPIGVQLFTEYLESEYSQENIHFWLRCEEYRTIHLDRKRRKKAAKLIWRTHLEEGCDEMVNLDSTIRHNIGERLKQAPLDLFDEAQAHVYTLMKLDCFARFVNSELVRNYLSSMENGNVCLETPNNVHLSWKKKFLSRSRRRNTDFMVGSGASSAPSSTTSSLSRQTQAVPQSTISCPPVLVSCPPPLPPKHSRPCLPPPRPREPPVVLNADDNPCNISFV